MASRSKPFRNLRILTGALAGFLALTAASGARANGRYPYSQQILVDPSDAARLWLRATYGILTSPDGGHTWSWLCDAAIGYSSTEDPMMAAASGGTVLAGAEEGLFVSTDHGCTWPTNAQIGDRIVRDLATQADPSHVLSLTQFVEPSGVNDVVVWGSVDAGATWAALGPSIASDIIPTTLDSSPSDANRIYVTGAPLFDSSDASVADASTPGSGVGVLLRSDDGGKSWVRRAIPGTDSGNQPFIAAVHPTNPDVLYVRVRGASTLANIQSWLLYSADGGDHWKEVLREPADMLGFALGADGATVLAGYGDTHDITRPVDSTVLGIYRASAPALTFARVFDGQVGCLRYAGPNLYVCGTHMNDGFEVAISTDDGSTVSKVFDYGDVAGPLSCPASTNQTEQCVPAWPYTCETFASCPRGPDAGPSASGGTSSGCGCGSPGKAKPTDDIGTTRLELTPDGTDAFAALAIVAAGLVRRRRAPKRRSRE